MPGVDPRGPKHVKVGFEDVPPSPTELDTLPRRFDLFATEVREALDSIGRQLLPIVNRIEVTLQNNSEALREGLAEIAAIRAEVVDLRARTERLEAAIAKPAPQPKTKARKRR